VRLSRSTEETRSGPGSPPAWCRSPRVGSRGRRKGSAALQSPPGSGWRPPVPAPVARSGRS